MDYLVIENAFKLINHPYTNEEVEYWVNYKEERYRQYGIEHNRIVVCLEIRRMEKLLV